MVVIVHLWDVNPIPLKKTKRNLIDHLLLQY